MEIHQAHDKLIKFALSRVEEAKSFFQNSLPESLNKLVDYSTLTRLNNTYVSENLKGLTSDILFQVKIADKPSYLYILFDHKSTPDKGIYLQLLKYMVEIWTEYTNNNEKWKKIPPIIPFVLYHGKPNWKLSANFIDIIDNDSDVINHYHLDYEYILHDLSNLTDDEIKGNIIVKTTLILLKHIFDKPEEWDRVYEILRNLYFELREDKGALDFIKATLVYLFNSDNVSDENVKKVIEESLGYKGGEIYMTVKEKWEKETKSEIAKKMLKKNTEIEYIIEVTELSREEIENLKKDQHN